MTRHKNMIATVSILLVLLLVSFGWASSDANTSSCWKAELQSVIKELNVPECVMVEPATGQAYISNIETASEQYWSDDGKGFISLISSDGKMKKLRWVNSTAEVPIHAPKGMCILDGLLYFADNSRLNRCPIDGTGEIAEVPVPGANIIFNDLATDGAKIYVSGSDKVFCVDPKGGHHLVAELEGVDGVACYKGKVFAVSWLLHEIYELDPAGKKTPQPFGLASHFTNLDGIEVLDDGTFIVSDITGNKVSMVAPDRKTVHTLLLVESPADIGLDRQRGLLYVPMLMKNEARIYKLSGE